MNEHPNKFYAIVPYHTIHDFHLNRKGKLKYATHVTKVEFGNHIVSSKTLSWTSIVLITSAEYAMLKMRGVPDLE